MFIIIFVTTKNKTQAQKIAKELLKKRLIACSNILTGIDSLFWWNRKIDKAQETLMILKSGKKHFSKIVKTVKSLHSYAVPEILALPIIDGNKEYLTWIKSSLLKNT